MSSTNKILIIPVIVLILISGILWFHFSEGRLFVKKWKKSDSITDLKKEESPVKKSTLSSEDTSYKAKKGISGSNRKNGKLRSPLSPSFGSFENYKPLNVPKRSVSGSKTQIAELKTDNTKKTDTSAKKTKSVPMASPSDYYWPGNRSLNNSNIYKQTDLKDLAQDPEKEETDPLKEKKELIASGGGYVPPKSKSNIGKNKPFVLNDANKTIPGSSNKTDMLPSNYRSYDPKDLAGDPEQNKVASNEQASEGSQNIPAVTGMYAAGSDSKVGLLWNNTGNDVQIIVNDAHFPVDPEDGIVVYTGNNNNALITGLQNGIPYYFTAFSIDATGSFSIPEKTSMASATPLDVTLDGPDPLPDEIIEYSPLDPDNVYGGSKISSVLTLPKGGGRLMGSTEVISLHCLPNNNKGSYGRYGGSITLKFTDNIIVNGSGPDFTVFENAFQVQGTDGYMMEPAVVDVSQDGKNYYRFPFDFVPKYDNDGRLDLSDPGVYAMGFAGINPVLTDNGRPDPRNPSESGGDHFDLSSLKENLSWIQYIRITSTGDNWLVDTNGDLVRHINDAATNACNGTGNSGFDLDTIVAINY